MQREWRPVENETGERLRCRSCRNDADFVKWYVDPEDVDEWVCGHVGLCSDCLALPDVQVWDYVGDFRLPGDGTHITVNEFSVPTDEGYSSGKDSMWIEWTNPEAMTGFIMRESYREGSDCDGPGSSYGLYKTPIAPCLGAVRPTEVRRPLAGVVSLVWEQVKSSQRDVFAERMGY